MRDTPRIPVRDDAAYEEKLGLILDGWSGDRMEPYREAEIAATATVFSQVCTEALYENWAPAWHWCAIICERFGDELATELLADIRAAVAKAHYWREALANNRKLSITRSLPGSGSA